MCPADALQSESMKAPARSHPARMRFFFKKIGEEGRSLVFSLSFSSTFYVRPHLSALATPVQGKSPGRACPSRALRQLPMLSIRKSRLNLGDTSGTQRPASVGPHCALRPFGLLRTTQLDAARLGTAPPTFRVHQERIMGVSRVSRVSSLNEHPKGAEGARFVDLSPLSAPMFLRGAAPGVGSFQTQPPVTRRVGLRET